MSTDSSVAPALSAPAVRLTSLDQFRGYTMFGMLLVNFLGGFKLVCPYILRHHHDYCSYADTIMPQFLFAAGFAMRLSLGKRLATGGKMPWVRAIRRVFGLALVAILWYGYCGIDGIIARFKTQPIEVLLYSLFKRELYQTLLHIAVTSLWILPVITSTWKVRAGFALFSGFLHIFVSWWFNYEWVHVSPGGIDGGPLGFLTWSIPALCGTIACDAVRVSGVQATLRIALSGVALMFVGWVISMPTVLYNVPSNKDANSAPAASDAIETGVKAVSKLDPNQFAPDPVIPTMERIRAWDGTFVEPPFVAPPDKSHRRWNYWMMSQRGGTLSYPTFAAGVSLVVYSLFLFLCDGLNLRLGMFRTLGTNSLVAYMLPEFSDRTLNLFFHGLEKTNSPFVALAAFAFTLMFVWGGCRLLERFGLYIRV